jgi:hypothetical protein
MQQMTDEQKTPGQIIYDAMDAYYKKHGGDVFRRIGDDWVSVPTPLAKAAHEAAAEAVRAPLLKHTEDLQEELRKRGERIAKLEARIEIDHVYMLDPDNEGGLVRVDVPPEERDEQIDGIDARDSTISLLDDRIAKLVARLDYPQL